MKLQNLIEIAKMSLDSDDVPIGAIITKDGKIISQGFNTREKDISVLGHAEINAILEASKVLGTWNLSDCEMYVTLKPCQMCTEIIKQSRFKNVYYLLEKPASKREYNKTNFEKLTDEKMEKEYQQLLQEFFRKLR